MLPPTSYFAEIPSTASIVMPNKNFLGDPCQSGLRQEAATSKTPTHWDPAATAAAAAAAATCPCPASVFFSLPAGHHEHANTYY